MPTIGRRPICWPGCPPACPAQSSMKSTSGRRMSTGVPSRISNLSLVAAADHLLGRDAVHLVRPWTHEIDAAARHDVRLEAVGAQIGQQFQHRLVHHRRVRLVESRVARRDEPLGDHARIRPSTCPCSSRRSSSSNPFSPPASAPLMSPCSSDANGSVVLPLGMLRREHLDPIDDEEELRIQRLFGPERSVVVEGGDARGDWNEIRRPGVVTLATKATMDCLTVPSFHDGSGSEPN